jgi:hypothetical protein
MPSDPPSFDEFKTAFIFVPKGTPEPPELSQGHRDWIKLPATLEQDAGGDGSGGQPAQMRAPGRRGSPAGSVNQGGTGQQVGHAASAEPSAAPGATTQPSDPIAAYHTANDGLQTASSRFAATPTGGSDVTTQGDDARQSDDENEHTRGTARDAP